MPSYAPHPLEARFIKLALLQQIVTPVQVKRCQDIVADRVAKGQANLSLEQILQEEGLLTEDECERLWDLIAKTGDTHIRDQIADKLGTRPGDAPIEETTSSSRSDPNRVPRRLGDYEIVEPIGRGGMGMVYKARQIQMERYVALKLLPPDLAKNAKYIRRFIREARAAGSLNHGNLVHVHDVGETEGRYFISMELVEGRTVKQIMRREGRVGILETLRMAEQVCAALECAHKHKIVHRDIKPDNIMVTPLGIAKLCDLGLAKVLEGGALQDTDTQDGHAMGTPHYMSPEQARSSGKVDARSDLYSLGATLYHMLTGRVPFDGDTPIEVLMRVTNEAPARPDRFEPLLPPPLTNLIMRLLAKDPNDRPSSAEQVRKEVHQLRRDLESGRVFVFDDLPLGMKVGKPVPAPVKPPEPHWRKWAMGVAAAMAFMGVCATGSRGQPSGSAAPPPEYGAFAHAPHAEKASTTSALPALGEDPRTERAVPEILALDPAGREQIEKRLAADPASWPKVLAALETISPEELAATSGEEQARWAALKANVLKLRDEDAERVFGRRVSGAEALAQAGLFRRAVALLDELPPHARGSAAIKEKAAAAKAEIGARMLKDIVDRAKGIDDLSRAGLPRAAWQACEAWALELESDGLNLKADASTPNPRVQAWRSASDGVRQASLREMADHEAANKALQETVTSIARVRALSNKNDVGGAKDEAQRLLRLSNSEPERLALGLEIERLKRVQALYDALSKAIAERPGRIKESDFRNNARVSGRIKSIDGDHLVVIADPGVVANVPLANITRAEMRALISHVMLKEEIVPDDLLGRLAFDLEDRSDSGIRLLLIDLASKDENAAALLGRLLACDAPWLRAQAREILDRAEEKFVQGRYYESQRLTAAALSTTGGIGDPSVEKRAQRLLELNADARMRGDLLHAMALPRPRGRIGAFYAAGDLTGRNSDWTWQGVRPSSLEDNALVFGTAPVTATPIWKLGAPALVEMDAYVPLDAQGQISITVTPVDADAGTPSRREGWTLRLDAGQDGILGSFARAGETPAPWSSTALPLARHQRLWMRLDVGVIRWGVEDRELGQRDACTSALWRVELKGEGGLHLYGVHVEGGLDTGRTLEQRMQEGVQALQQALRAEGQARTDALKGILVDYGAYPQITSLACAWLADAYRAERRGAETRYWESRALFECPSSSWPAQTRVLLADHRLWLNARDRLGPTATDALRYGRLDAYNQPSLTVGEPEKKPDEPAEEKKDPAPQQNPDGKVENEEADQKKPQRPYVFKVITKSNPEQGVGLREPQE